MKKTIIYLFLMLCSLFAQAQVSYRIDAIQGGGFYLVEIVPATPGDPNSFAKEFPQRFDAPGQLKDYVDGLRQKAKEAREQAAKLLEAAPALDSIAAKVGRYGDAYFAPKPPPVAVTPEPKNPPGKPKKKKRQ